MGRRIELGELPALMGNATVRRMILTILPLVGTLAIASDAQAYTFTLSGDGISASGTFNVGPDPHAGAAFGTGTTASVPPPGYFGLADPTNALTITDVSSGTFSDTNLGISNVAITGLVANNYLPHFENDQNIPFSFSWWTGTGFPAPPSALLSYDNLFYPAAGAPVTCMDVPAGGFLDNYGMMLTLANGDVVDIWSDGGSGNMIYGAAVADATSILDYQDPYPGNPAWAGPASQYNLTFTAAPEPSTWAMMALGFAGLGFVGHRKAKGRTPAPSAA